MAVFQALQIYDQPECKSLIWNYIFAIKLKKYCITLFRTCSLEGRRGALASSEGDEASDADGLSDPSVFRPALLLCKLRMKINRF